MHFIMFLSFRVVSVNEMRKLNLFDVFPRIETNTMLVSNVIASVSRALKFPGT